MGTTTRTHTIALFIFGGSLLFIALICALSPAERTLGMGIMAALSIGGVFASLD